MKVLILPNTLESGIHAQAASARIRGLWVWKYLKRRNFEVYFNEPARVEEMDVIIFQKFYESPLARDLMWIAKKSGKITVLDLCDADWEDQRKASRLLSILPNVCYGVGASTTITSWFLRKGIPAFHIPDGVDTEETNLFKTHTERTPLTLVWFGNKSNFSLVEGKEIEAASSGCRLVTISDHPRALRKWCLDTIDQELMACDIFWDPRGSGVWFECKSNNKELKAWSVGLPVIHEEVLGAQLDRFRSSEERKKEAKFRLEMVRSFYSMEVTVGYWVSFLNLVGGQKC